MLKNRISGLPVIDDNGNLIGIVSEGDFYADLRQALSAGDRLGLMRFSVRASPQMAMFALMGRKSKR
jgi:CBS-domain-containing membrane protein